HESILSRNNRVFWFPVPIISPCRSTPRCARYIVSCIARCRMNALRQLRLVSLFDGARLAMRFPRTAIDILEDCFGAPRSTAFPRRIGLFLTNRCDFDCPMCAVRDVRNEGLARGGDLPFEIVDKVLVECSPFQPVMDFIGGEPLLYPQL